jgi:hypothetical protein
LSGAAIPNFSWLLSCEYGATTLRSARAGVDPASPLPAPLSSSPTWRCRANYAFRFTDPKTNKPTTEHGNRVMGYKVQPDGSWKLAWGVVSDTGEAPSPAR